MHLVRRRSDGYPNVTVSTEPCGQADPQSFQNGYMEARMRYNTVRGTGRRSGWSSQGTRPTRLPEHPSRLRAHSPYAPCLTSELDIFEGFGNIHDGGSRTDDFFSGAYIATRASSTVSPRVPLRSARHGSGPAQWHTYAALWTDSNVSYYVDGQLQGVVSTYDSTRQPMHLLLYNWNTDWEDENMPNAGTPDRLDVSVNWVRVWQQ